MQQSVKRIVSLWLPHWPIERLARHTLGAVPADRPLALVESGVHGLIVTAVNACATESGVEVGTSLADARAALPGLLSRPAELARDQRALIKLTRWLQRYGPACNRDGPDAVWIDVTGVAHLFGGEDRLLHDLIQRLSGFGIKARAGLAGTLGAAHALARFSTGACPFAIAPVEGERTACAALPIESLRLAPDTILLLKRLGLRRIGQLYDVPRAALERRFHTERASKSKARELSYQAEAVVMRLDQALGLTHEPLRSLGALPVLSVRRTWGEPLISSEALDSEIDALIGELCTSLKAQTLGVRQVRLTLYRADGTLASVEAGFNTATCETAHMMRLVREKLGNLDAGFGVDMAVADGFGAERSRASQSSLETHSSTATNGALALLIDRLSNRLGPRNIYTLEPYASHVPERGQRRRAPGEPVVNVHGITSLPSLHARSPAARRPAFLLAPPEPVTVMAEVPEGIPRHFVWRRVRHRVVKGEGPERIAPEWWRHIGTSNPARAAAGPRDYYHLEDESGARFWMFREGLYQEAEAEAPPRWFVHGLFA